MILFFIFAFALFGVVSGMGAKLGEALLDGFSHLSGEIGKVFESIRWDLVLKNLEELSHQIGRFLVEVNPIHLVWMGVSTFPLTEHMASELNKLTGGAMNTLDDISTLTGRTLRGDAIKKEELIADCMFAAKVASVIVSGGTSIAIISASADQMKKGTLGETELGRAILQVAAVSGIAYAQNADFVTAAEHETIRQGMQSGQAEVIKHSPISDSEWGRALIQTAFAGATSGLTGGSITTGAMTEAQRSTASNAATAVSQQLGVPVTGQMVEAMASAGYPPDASKVDFNKLPSNVSWNDVVSAIGKINLQFGIGDINLTLPTTGTLISDTTKSSSLIETQDVDWTQAHISPVRIAGVNLSLPNPLNEQGMAEIIKYWLLIDLIFGGKHCKYRKRFQVGTRYVWVYVTDDNTFLYDLESLIPWLAVGALGLLAFGGLLMLSKKKG